jgi:hypothetical protein
MPARNLVGIVAGITFDNGHGAPAANTKGRKYVRIDTSPLRGRAVLAIMRSNFAGANRLQTGYMQILIM